MTRKPRVAITVGIDSRAWQPDNDGGRYAPYAESIREAGGEPEMLGVDRRAEAFANPSAFLLQFDGLLLSGGADVHPAEYPNPPRFPGRTWEEVLAEHHMRVDAGRDAMELALAHAACDMGRPTLGICRGLQVLNVALGGQLILDLDPEWGHKAHPDGTSAQHLARVAAGSRLSRVLGRHGDLPVNSRHHQGVDDERLAPLLRPAALAPDGIVIEAIEAPYHPWLVGVQWHPERPQDEECHQACRPLFAAFIAACRG